MSGIHVLAIGAHAGDLDLTAGAVLAQHVMNGDRATLLHLTLGERGHPRTPVAEYAKQKREEAETFADRIGAGVGFLDYEDGLLPEDDDVKMRVGDQIRELRPDVILTHWSASIHKDHARTHRIVQDARFFGGLKTLEREHPAYWAGELYYADNWEDAEGFAPDVFVDLRDEAYEVWSQAITGYAFARGETYGFPYVDYYRALTIVRGAPAGFRRAQAFAAPKGSRDLRLTHFGPNERASERADAGADERANAGADAGADERADAGADERADAGADERANAGADERANGATDGSVNGDADRRSGKGADAGAGGGAT